MVNTNKNSCAYRNTSPDPGLGRIVPEATAGWELTAAVAGSCRGVSGVRGSCEHLEEGGVQGQAN